MRRRIATGIAAGALLAPLAACATNTSAEPVETPDPTPSERTLLTARGTVLDDGDGAELCLGLVMESLPPQCGGPAIIGWDWAPLDGTYEEGEGWDTDTGVFEDGDRVRWGLYDVDGYYDAGKRAFELVEARAATHDGGDADSSDRRGTPCQQPTGGWRVEDDSLVSETDQSAAFELAATLDGYSTAWVDQSPNPASALGSNDYEDPLDWEKAMNDPFLTIINVKVTGDVAAAEREIRTVWSGMLCVTQGERSEKELHRIQEDLATIDGVLFSSTDGIDGVVEVTVIYDDGSVQAELDERYGEGVVEISSALQPKESARM